LLRAVSGLLLALLCVGCVTIERPETASGRPEVTIANASPEAIKPALVSYMLDAGFRITKDTPYELAFDKPVQNIAAAVLFGSRYDAQPNVRVSYSFAQFQSSTRVIADIAVITNPASAFERRTEMNSGVDSADIQVLLDKIKSQLDPTSAGAVARRNNIVLGIGLMDAARARIAGMHGPEKGLYVVSVDPGSVADRAGISRGDVIQTFNDEPVNTLREMVAAESKVKAGTTVKLSIWREGRDMKTQVTFVAPQHSVDRQRPQHTKSNTARAAQ
jgi:hypothetical protein